MKMTSIPVLALALSLLGVAQAAEKTVNCVSATNGYEATITGVLTVQETPTGEFSAEGQLSVQLGLTRTQPNPVRTVLFKGNYNKIRGLEYSRLGAVNEGLADALTVDSLFVAFSDAPARSESYVEMHSGTWHMLNCSASF